LASSPSAKDQLGQWLDVLKVPLTIPAKLTELGGFAAAHGCWFFDGLAHR
jgi:hypothetical protein